MFYRVEMNTEYYNGYAFVDTMEEALKMKEIAERFNNKVTIRNGLTGEKIA